MHLVSKVCILFVFQSQQAGSMFHGVEKDGSDKKLVGFELTCKADGVAPPVPVLSGHCCHC